ncbi:Piso0_005606 [Millerozyma farinosa CBS 7064]|uniref:Piso0_005606 protein n=1 Tax=Pichia sorbitophila (strain ATCC MYA-4447 / BCRC 22081 / CBS 7064 / NBRC 10061 / NRRL Y-12695) TaxID=559304 RepID=G8XZG0_PICSO|nr:Piso0_005606 [Millerozyma farinosa CBS 7064]
MVAWRSSGHSTRRQLEQLNTRGALSAISMRTANQRRKNDDDDKGHKSDDDDVTILMTLYTTYTISTSLESGSGKLSGSGSKNARSDRTKSGSSGSDSPTTVVSATATSTSVVSSASSGGHRSHHSATGSLSHSASSDATNASINAMMQSSSNNANSVRIGLAVGIPVAVLSVLVGIGLLWYYIKKRSFRKIRENHYLYRDSPTGPAANEKSAPFDTNPYNKQSLVDSSSTLGDEATTNVRFDAVPVRQAARNSMSHLFKRLSRSLHIRPGTPQNELAGQNSSANSSIPSPLYLKNFNLVNNVSRPADAYSGRDRLERTNGFFASKGETDDKITRQVVRKKRPVLPPLINTYPSISPVSSDSSIYSSRAHQKLV